MWWMPCSVLSGQGLGGGQGWTDAQWETVLQLVANLITPESLFRLLVITTPPPPQSLLILPSSASAFATFWSAQKPPMSFGAGRN